MVDTFRGNLEMETCSFMFCFLSASQLPHLCNVEMRHDPQPPFTLQYGMNRRVQITVIYLLTDIIWTNNALIRSNEYYSFPGGSDGKESTCNAGAWVRSLGWKDPLEKGMATHSSILV